MPTGAPSGFITKIYFQASTSASATYTQLKIRMALTTAVDLPTGAWYADSMTTVFDQNNFNLTGTLGSFSGITLGTPFYYDSTKSLVVEVTQCGFSGSGINIYYESLSGIKRSAGPLTLLSCPHPWGNQNGYSTHTGLDINTTVGILPVNGVIPVDFKLNQNYPNPFNPATQISFSIPVNGHTSLIVYDILGHQVKELINQNVQKGNYSISFDASGLSSGTYFYTLLSGGYIETKKMVLVK